VSCAFAGAATTSAASEAARRNGFSMGKSFGKE
jgi:hypothetical protein